MWKPRKPTILFGKKIINLTLYLGRVKDLCDGNASLNLWEVIGPRYTLKKGYWDDNFDPQLYYVFSPGEHSTIKNGLRSLHYGDVIKLWSWSGVRTKTQYVRVEKFT